MIKHFCDGCNKEINRNFMSERLKRKLQLNGQRFEIEIMVLKNGTANQGDLCLNCLTNIFKLGRE